MYLRAWALSQGIHPQTAYRWHRTGKMPVPTRKVGKLILAGDLESEDPKHGSSVIYARVLSSDQRPALDRRVALVEPPRVSLKPRGGSTSFLALSLAGLCVIPLEKVGLRHALS